MLIKEKKRIIAVILAFSGTIIISGLHKFYLGQPRWGILYVLLSWTPIPHVASAIECVWYLTQDQETFDRHFNFLNVDRNQSQVISSGSNQVELVANALRELEALRQEGL
ncbi:MAG: TM2 domain-containing protein, partial [Dolichospermum sp.]